MAAKNRTLTVYPDPNARAIAAWNSPAANLAIECWAEMLLRAKPPTLTREDWNLLADVLNGTIMDASWGVMHLSAEIEDADRLNGAGQKWYGAATAKRSISKVIAAVRGCDHAGLWSILTAVRWFWDHHESIDTEVAEWWTVEFRTLFAKARANERADA